MSADSTGAQTTKSLETWFTLHGIVWIRVLDGGPSELASIARQLGPAVTDRPDEADITIRCVERIPLAEPIRTIGLDDAGFSGDQFLILRGRFKSRARVAMPLDRVGSPCEIICEHGTGRVPLLIAIVNLTALAKGVLPLHAAAFTYRGTGVVATGWSKGGKTEMQLAFLRAGATFVGDEWVYFSADGECMYGIPEPVRIWKWHLDHLPELRAAVPRTVRLRFGSFGALLGGIRRLTGNGTRHRGRIARTLNRLAPLVRGQLGADVPPEQLFGGEALTFRGHPDAWLFVGGRQADEVSVQDISGEEIARRMAVSLEEEQQPLESYYRRFRFAFPGRRNELIDRSDELRRAALDRLLAGVEGWELRHPYPVPIDRSFRAVRDAIQWKESDTGG